MKRFLALLFSVMILFTYVLAAEEPLTETSADESVTETPVEEPVTETPVEEPVSEIPVEDPITDTLVEDPLTELPLKDRLTEIRDVDPVTETPSEESVSSGGGGGDVYIEAPDVYVMGSDIPADATITDISVMSLAPITPSDTSGLKAILLSLIGDYDPVIIEYEYESSNGYTNYLREVQPDYVWLCSVGLFAIMVYCVFRLGGALIRD